MKSFFILFFLKLFMKRGVSIFVKLPFSVVKVGFYPPSGMELKGLYKSQEIPGSTFCGCVSGHTAHPTSFDFCHFRCHSKINHCITKYLLSLQLTSTFVHTVHRFQQRTKDQNVNVDIHGWCRWSQSET